MNKLEKRAERIALARQRAAIGLIAARLSEELRGARIEIDASEIRIRGAGMVKRWLSETRLRFVGGSFR
jgi:hypothetical protein